MDLWFSAFEGRLGLLLLALLLAAAVLGGLVVTLGVVLPLRRSLARTRADAPKSEGGPSP